MAEATAQKTAKQSRVGKRPIPIPGGVSVTVGEGRVEVKGPKGTLSERLPDPPEYKILGDDDQ